MYDEYKTRTKLKTKPLKVVSSGYTRDLFKINIILYILYIRYVLIIKSHDFNRRVLQVSDLCENGLI